MFLNSMFQTDAIPLLEKALSFSEARHGVLASNVANAETPNYRRQDLPVKDFQKAMQEAVARRERHRGHFAMDPVSLTGQVDRGPFLFRPNDAGMLRHDNNNVDMDREMALLGRNGLYHSTVAALLRKKFGGLRRALNEGRAG